MTAYPQLLDRVRWWWTFLDAHANDISLTGSGGRVAATQRPRPSPPPRLQRRTAIRARQLPGRQLPLDLYRVRPYREHSASKRFTALPGESAKRHREGLCMPFVGKVPPPTNSPASRNMHPILSADRMPHSAHYVGIFKVVQQRPEEER